MRMSVEWRGSDRLAVHIREHEVLVGEPGEIGGSDAGPTPTELFVASLAACVAYYAELFLRRHQLLDGDFSVDCNFEVSTDRPARVTAIDVTVNVAGAVDAQWHDALQRVVDHCAVHNSLRTPPEVRIHVAAPVSGGAGTPPG
jgi:putative redox protein